MTDSQFELTITIGDTEFSGWTATRFSRSCEQFPSSFEISATSKNPSGQQNVFVPFSPCQVKINGTLVCTGYIDSIMDMIDPHAHSVTLLGRSKCADLVDCSAEIEQDNVNGSIPLMNVTGNILEIATMLCQPYGITVSDRSSVGLTTLPTFHINIGDTPYNIIELMARSQNLLVYDDVDGNLVLADVGQSEHSSGFQYGVNIQALSVTTRFDQRYSEIDVFDQSILSQAATGPANIYGKSFDPNIRHRRYMGFSEAPYVNQQFWAQKRADWEMSRRQGRSQVVHLQTDSWVDSSGTLWQPNSYVTVATPSLSAKWIIADVVFSKDLSGGTYADLTIMPPTAFSPEPTSLAVLDTGLQAGVGQRPATSVPSAPSSNIGLNPGPI